MILARTFLTSSSTTATTAIGASSSSTVGPIHIGNTLLFKYTTTFRSRSRYRSSIQRFQHHFATIDQNLFLRFPSTSSSTRTTTATTRRGYSKSFFTTSSALSCSKSSSSTTATRIEESFTSIDDFFTKQQDIIITYMTDVEGDKAYLDRYVEMSKVLTFIKNVNNNNNNNNNNSQSKTTTTTYFPYNKRMDFLDDHSILVYGGDVWDKGGYDLYVIRQLIDLKQRYPNRVVLILGNRDINKLRILQEIGLLGFPLVDHPGLLWFKGTGKIGDPDLSINPTPNTAAERLQWMLANTMGSPDAFEHRRNELLWEKKMFSTKYNNNYYDDYNENDNNEPPTTNNNNEELTVSDEEVVESYQRSCHPKGELGQYLSQACLAQKIGPLLFVHGSLPLTKDTMKQAQIEGRSVWDDFTAFMPWLKPGESAAKDYGVVTAQDWLNALNAFCQNKVQEWKEEIERIEEEIQPPPPGGGGRDDDDDDYRNEDDSRNNKDSIWAYKGGYHYGPSYSGLLQYGMGMLPGKQINPSVVYNSFTPSGMPERFIPDSDNYNEHYMKCTKEFFDRANIEVILVGHKPQGDLPSPIRVDSTSWVLCCDTSYSGDTIWHHHDELETSVERRSNLGRGNSVSFRGEVAVSEVLLELTAPSTLRSVKYHGVLSDGTEYGTFNLLDHAHNSSIGQVAPDHLVPSELDSPHQGRWWTKSIFSDGVHLFHAGEGFNIWNFLSKPRTHT